MRPPHTISGIKFIRDEANNVSEGLKSVADMNGPVAQLG